jgi:hypothetical protein
MGKFEELDTAKIILFGLFSSNFIVILKLLNGFL